MSGQRSMFGVDERYAALSASVDPLQRLLSVVDFEVFRPILSSALALLEGAKGGPPPYDPVLMFKLLVLQALYSLSDEQAEFQMRDRLSFRRFVGLEFHDPVPDAKTIWLYREQLKRAGEMESLFRRHRLSPDGWANCRGHRRRTEPGADRGRGGDHRRGRHASGMAKRQTPAEGLWRALDRQAGAFQFESRRWCGRQKLRTW
jgi:Transposase domain (DUF772)